MAIHFAEVQLTETGWHLAANDLPDRYRTYERATGNISEMLQWEEVDPGNQTSYVYIRREPHTILRVDHANQQGDSIRESHLDMRGMIPGAKVNVHYEQGNTVRENPFSRPPITTTNEVTHKSLTSLEWLIVMAAFISLNLPEELFAEPKPISFDETLEPLVTRQPTRRIS